MNERMKQLQTERDIGSAGMVFFSIIAVNGLALAFGSLRVILASLFCSGLCILVAHWLGKKVIKGRSGESE